MAAYGPAAAAILTYDASLNGATEIPPTGSPGTGFAVVTIDTVADTMNVQESFSICQCRSRLRQSRLI
jgi:hypothetical protein